MDDLPPHTMDEDPKPDTTPRTNFPPDYSDVASNDSQGSSKGRRKYERGGRKKTNERQRSSLNTSSSTPRTGIRSFNIRRAQESGGGRPFGVTVEDPNKKPKTKPKPKAKAKAKSKSKPGNENDADVVDEYDDVDEEEEEEEEEEEQQQQEQPRKPLQIRLDLNLELEIFLKAKIKGDVTITFLE